MRRAAIARVLRLSLVVLAGFSCTAIEAKVHALVVGIDDYQNLPPLAGAVNDASDIALSLNKIPGSEVSVLLDEQASFAEIKQRWFAMLERSKAGDTLVFSYAGHGSRVPELVPGSEADGLDDVFVLGGYASTRIGQQELIRDNQLFEWFSAAKGKGVQLLFVADSCHSGTMTRAADPRIKSLRSRQVDIDFGLGLEAELTVELDTESAELGRLDLPFLTFLSAGLESQQIPEIIVKSIGGRSDTRGALSFVVARALEGEADLDGDTVLTRAELRRYVLENVSVLSERQQTPELSPLTQPGQAVLALVDKSTKPPIVDMQSIHRVYSNGVDSDLKHNLEQDIVALRWVSEADSADLIFDASSGDLLSAAGDLVATGLQTSNEKKLRAQLRGALEKRTALHALKSAVRSNNLLTDLAPSSASHRTGAQITPSFSQQSGDYLVVLNLAGDGTLQLIYPLALLGDALLYGKRRWSMPLAVSTPLGEDHMIALAFQQEQPELLKALAELDGSRAALRVVAMLKPLLEKAEVEVGIIGMFSQH